MQTAPIEDLIKLCRPPATPRGGITDKWLSDFEHFIGFALPRDYKELLLTYGLGHFVDTTEYEVSPFLLLTLSRWKEGGFYDLLTPEEIYSTVKEEASEYNQDRVEYADSEGFAGLPTGWYPTFNPGLVNFGSVYGEWYVLMWLVNQDCGPLLFLLPSNGPSDTPIALDMTITTFLVRLFLRELDSIGGFDDVWTSSGEPKEWAHFVPWE